MSYCQYWGSMGLFAAPLNSSLQVRFQLWADAPIVKTQVKIANISEVFMLMARKKSSSGRTPVSMTRAPSRGSEDHSAPKRERERQFQLPLWVSARQLRSLVCLSRDATKGMTTAAEADGANRSPPVTESLVLRLRKRFQELHRVRFVLIHNPRLKPLPS